MTNEEWIRKMPRELLIKQLNCSFCTRRNATDCSGFDCRHYIEEYLLQEHKE